MLGFWFQKLLDPFVPALSLFIYSINIYCLEVEERYRKQDPCPQGPLSPVGESKVHYREELEIPVPQMRESSNFACASKRRN